MRASSLPPSVVKYLNSPLLWGLQAGSVHISSPTSFLGHMWMMCEGEVRFAVLPMAGLKKGIAATDGIEPDEVTVSKIGDWVQKLQTIHWKPDAIDVEMKALADKGFNAFFSTLREEEILFQPPASVIVMAPLDNKAATGCIVKYVDANISTKSGLGDLHDALPVVHPIKKGLKSMIDAMVTSGDSG